VLIPEEAATVVEQANAVSKVVRRLSSQPLGGEILSSWSCRDCDEAQSLCRDHQISKEAIALARALIDEGVLADKAVGDALHIAIATVHGMDYLLTWNLKHLANATIRNAIAITCRACGYEPAVICTAEELLEE